jgi:hypothetical protein
MYRSANQKAFLLPVVMSLLISALSGCQGWANPGPTLPMPDVAASLTQVAKDILADPKGFEGRSVTLVGYYRGWDLLGEVGSGPPVTRSDWVIRDGGGAIYVRAGLAVEGDVPLNAGSKEDTQKVLRVTGIVRLTGEGRPYIDPQRIELIR